MGQWDRPTEPTPTISWEDTFFVSVLLSISFGAVYSAKGRARLDPNLFYEEVLAGHGFSCPKRWHHFYVRGGLVLKHRSRQKHGHKDRVNNGEKGESTLPTGNAVV
jgi:hypothetical protein